MSLNSWCTIKLVSYDPELHKWLSNVTHYSLEDGKTTVLMKVIVLSHCMYVTLNNYCVLLEPGHHLIDVLVGLLMTNSSVCRSYKQLSPGL